ncbi:MAG: YcbK family protein [Acidobacteria bacterium]|nr:YcbK family protein [Acidobacteriota bacterium]
MAGVLAAVPGASRGSAAPPALPLPRERLLAFHNTHTGERLKTVYCIQGDYQKDALRDLNYILRDFRVNEVKDIDPNLFDLLYRLSDRLETREPFHIISGYRSPATNAILQLRSEGVAKRSLHMVGKAIDLRVPGVQLRDVHKAAVGLRGGGVGYYPSSDFVHVDVGRPRYW